MFSSKALPPTFASALELTTRPLFFGTWLGLALISYWCFDEAIAFYIHDHLPRDVRLIFKQISKLGVAGYYLGILAVCYGLFRYLFRTDYFLKVTVYLASVIIIPGLFCDAIKIIVGRYRPRMLFSDELYGLHFFTLKSKMWSFPSGHSVTFMSLMVALSFLMPRYWKWLWTFGAFICLTRVLVTAHYLSDVMVGAYIGMLGAVFCKAWVEQSNFITTRLLLPSPTPPS